MSTKLAPPLAVSPRPPLTGEGTLHPRPEPATVSRAVLVPAPAPASGHAGCELGRHRRRPRRDQCGWHGLNAAAPAPSPCPAAGLCPGLRKGAPPALGAHQPTVMELTTSGRLCPALARPSWPPVPLWPVQAPPCQPVLLALSPLLSPAQGPCPQPRRSEGQHRRKTPACQAPWV